MPKASPFEAVHRVLGANFAEYDGWWLPKDYGDRLAEARALAQGCAAFDLSSFGKITIEGAHSKALIDRLLAGDPAGLPDCDGKWIWAAVSSARQADAVRQDCRVRVGKTDAGFTVFTLPGQRQTLLALAGASADEAGLGDVKIADITEKNAMLGMYGPEAVRIADSILPFDIAGIGEAELKKISLFMISATIIRGSWLGADGVELLCPASVAQMAAGVVAKYRKRANITPAGIDCLERAIAEARIDYSTGPNRRQTSS